MITPRLPSGRRRIRRPLYSRGRGAFGRWRACRRRRGRRTPGPASDLAAVPLIRIGPLLITRRRRSRGRGRRFGRRSLTRLSRGSGRRSRRRSSDGSRGGRRGRGVCRLRVVRRTWPFDHDDTDTDPQQHEREKNEDDQTAIPPTGHLSTVRRRTRRCWNSRSPTRTRLGSPPKRRTQDSTS